MPFNWNFRKSRKVAKGVRVNVSKGGPSVRVGGKRGGVSVGKRGARPSFRIFGITIRL